MAAITVHPFTSTRSAAPARPSDAAGRTAPDVVPGPDERSLARTTAAVVTALLLLTGVLVGAAYGAGTLVNSVATWFLG